MPFTNGNPRLHACTERGDVTPHARENGVRNGTTRSLERVSSPVTSLSVEAKFASAETTSVELSE